MIVRIPDLGVAEAMVEPPGKAVAEPPEEAEALAEPPGKARAGPPGEAMAEPPGVAATEPPGETVAEPPGETAMAEAPSNKEGAVTSCSGVVKTEAPCDIFCSGLTVGELGAEAETRTDLIVAAGEAGADLPLFCPDFSEP